MRRLRVGAGTFGSRIPHFLLRFDEFLIVRRIEIQQRAAGLEVLDERLADGIVASGRQYRHHEGRRYRAEQRHALERAGGAHAARHRDHGAGKTGDQCLTAVFRELHVIDLRQAAQHLQLNSADSKHVDEGQRYQTADAGPQGKAVDQFSSRHMSLLGRLRRGLAGLGTFCRLLCHSRSSLVTSARARHSLEPIAIELCACSTTDSQRYHGGWPGASGCNSCEFSRTYALTYCVQCVQERAPTLAALSASHPPMVWNAATPYFGIGSGWPKRSQRAVRSLL